MRLVIGVFLAASTCSACAATSGQPGPDGLVPFDTAAPPASGPMDRAKLTYVCHSQFPRRGIVLEQGSFLSNAAMLVTVDFDGRRVRRVTTERVRGSDRPVIQTDDSAELDPGEVNRVIRLANHVWRYGVRAPPPTPVTDAVTGIIVLNGDLASVEDHAIDYQAGRDAADEVADLARRKMPRSTPAGTDVPCDPG